MPQRNITKTKIIEAATEIGNQEGLHALSMPKIARSLGIRSQSLYNHVGNLDEILTGISLHLTEEAHDTILNGLIGQSGPAAVLSFCQLTRKFWLAHLRLAPLLFTRPETATAPDLLQARQATIDILNTILTDILTTPTAITLCSKTIRSAVTGFCIEEVQATRTAQSDQQFDQMVQVILDAFIAAS